MGFDFASLTLFLFWILSRSFESFAKTSMGGTIAALGPRGATGHDLLFVVRVVLQGDEWVFHLGEIGWILLTPRLNKWKGTDLIRFVLTPVLSPLLTLALVFDFVGGRHGGLLVD
jgi:hypothetical protein